MPLRDPTAEEVSQLIDQGVILNEPGADLLTRWLAKTFAANPEEAKQFLERRGFEVLRTDRVKLQFAIRNRAVSELVGEKNNPWKVLDPKEFELADIADLAFDVFIAGPVIAAFQTGGAIAGAAGGTLLAPGPGTIAGGVVGAPLGGAVGGGGIEAIRQAVGGLAGVNIQADIPAVQRAALFSAVLPGLAARMSRFPQALLRAGKFINKKLVSISRSMGALVSATTEESLQTAAASASRTATILSQRQPQAIELLDQMRGVIQRLRLPANRFPESREIDSLLEKARPVPLRGLFTILEQGRVQPVGKQRIGVLTSRRMAQQIAQRLGFASPESAAAGRISAQQAQELKRLIQAEVDFTGRPGEKFLNRVLKRAQGNLSNRIVASLPSSQARSRYRTLNGFASFTDSAGRFHRGRGVVGKMEALNELNARLGEHKTADTAEQFLKNITKPGARTQDRRLVDQFDNLFGTQFVEAGTLARVGPQFVRDVPKLTATGRLLGVSAAAIAGEQIAGLPGAAAGAAFGLEVFSPRGMLRIGRGLTVTERAARRAIGATGRGLQRVEPLQDFLARTGGGALAVSPPPGQAFQAVQRATEIPAPELVSQTPAQAAAARQLMEEVNAIPGLTGEQRRTELDRRIQLMLEQAEPIQEAPGIR